MKKRTLLLLGALFACVISALLLKSTAEAKSPSISKNKKTVSFSMSSNPTTGYDWSYKVNQKGIVKCIKDQYVSDVEDSEIPVSGAGGTQYYTFRAEKAGTVVITFRYQRAWEKTEYDLVKRYKIKVGKDLTIKSAEKIK